MRKLLAAFFLLAAISVGGAETNAFFPLMAWNWAPGDANVLQKMRECGLTVAGFVAPKDLDLCAAAGLKAIVSDARVSNYDWKNVDEAAARKNVQSLIAEVGEKSAVYGYYLRDEPGAEWFEGLGKVAALVRELAPGKWPYINLFPNYANAQQLGTATYEEHLEKFVAACKPTQLSYDHYALMDDGSLRDGYWQNLESMRAAAKRHALPFWNIVLAVAHFNYREPTAADLRFQVYSTLAYGGRGIAYFTYFAPNVGNYRGAPIDQFGNATAAWDNLRNVNLQVAKLAPVLLQLSSDEVYHPGNIPNGCKAPSEKSLLKSAGHPDLMCGDFTHANGARYVLVVNKNPTTSRYCAPQFRVSPKRIQLVSPFTGDHIDFGGEQQWLAPGQGALLKIEP